MSINGSIFSESDERQFGNEPEDCVTAVKIAGITVPNIATKIYEGNEIPPDVTSMKLSEEMVTSGSFNVETSLRSGGHPNTSNWLSRKPKPGTALHFMSVSACVFACYLCYGVLQEMIFTNKELKPYGWFLTWIQFAFYVFFGSCEFMSHGKIIRHVPMSTYLLLAFLTVATMGLSNTSLRYLNYPTQVIFKSCKLIPVMIGGICIQNKRYKMIDYLAMLMLCSGLIWFTLADSTVQPNFDVTGVLVISMALSADAIIGNAQEKFMKKYSASNTEMVFFSYAIGVIYIFLIIIWEGTYFAALSQINTKTCILTFFFSLTGYCGVKLVLDLIVTYGALIAVTVTTCRKALSIVISFVAFSKPFTVQYIFAGLVIVMGIFLNVYSKNADVVETQVHNMLLCAKHYAKSCKSNTSVAKSYKMVQSV